MGYTTYFVLLWLFSWSAFYLSCSGQSFNQSRALLHALLENNDNRLRPNINQSEPTVVNVSMTILNIEDFDEVNSKFSVTAFLTITWMDEIMRWNPETNHGISSLVFPVADVWYPDLILGYSNGKFASSVDRWMDVRIFYSGLSYLIPGDSYQSTCSADVTYYPFDVQNCSLVFVTWGYYGTEVKLNTPDPYINDFYFIDNGEWEIIENATIGSVPSDVSATFTFLIRRKPMFFVVNIILPIIVMSVLNIMVFALPPQSGERVSYSITVLLAIAVFLTMVGDNLPKTSTPMSLLCYFLMTNLMASALICVLVIFNLRVYFRDGTTPLPKWLRLCIRITCSSCSGQSDATKTYADTAFSDQNGTKHPDDITENKRDCPRLTWTDASRALDKLCMTFFLLLIICTSTTFLFVLRQR